jgi:hypothetical protein
MPTKNARHFGIGSALYMLIGALCCGLVAVAFLKETAPHPVRHQEPRPPDHETGIGRIH